MGLTCTWAAWSSALLMPPGEAGGEGRTWKNQNPAAVLAPSWKQVLAGEGREALTVHLLPGLEKETCLIPVETDQEPEFAPSYNLVTENLVLTQYTLHLGFHRYCLQGECGEIPFDFLDLWFQGSAALVSSDVRRLCPVHKTVELSLVLGPCSGKLETARPPAVLETWGGGGAELSAILDSAPLHQPAAASQHQP